MPGPHPRSARGEDKASGFTWTHANSGGGFPSRGLRASRECHKAAGRREALSPAEPSWVQTEPVTMRRGTARGAQHGAGGGRGPQVITPRGNRALTLLPLAAAEPWRPSLFPLTPGAGGDPARKVRSPLARPEPPVRFGGALPGPLPTQGHSPVVRHCGQVETLRGEADGAQGAGVDFAAVVQRRVQGDMAGGWTSPASAPRCRQPHPQSSGAGRGSKPGKPDPALTGERWWLCPAQRDSHTQPQKSPTALLRPLPESPTVPWLRTAASAAAPRCRGPT